MTSPMLLGAAAASRHPNHSFRHHSRRFVAAKSTPERSSISSLWLILTLRLSPSPTVGQAYRPRPSFFVQTHKPLPSQTSTLSLVRAPLANKKTWPLNGASSKTPSTRAQSPSNPFRKSVAPAAKYTFVAALSANMSYPLRRPHASRSTLLPTPRPLPTPHALRWAR